MAPITVPDLVDQIAERAPHDHALAHLGPTGAFRHLSYGQLAEDSRRIARALAARGVSSGDAVAIWLPNQPEWLVIALAAMRVGAFVAPINTRFRFGDAADVIRASGATTVVVRDEFLGVDFPAQLAQALDLVDDEVDRKAIVVGLRPNASPSPIDGCDEVVPYEVLVRTSAPWHAPRVDPTSPAHLYVSSGTTGAPKLAVHTHDSIVSRSLAAGARFGIGADSAMLGVLPFAGAWGYSAAFVTLANGACLVIIDRFDPATCIDAIEACRITHVHGSDDMLRAIIHHESYDRDRCATWTSTHYGNFTGLAGVELIHEGSAAGVNFSAAYGASEFHAFVAAWRGDEDPETRSQAGGWIVNDDVEIRCVDLDTGAVLGHGERGEIQVRGRSVFTCYLGDEELTDAALDPEGWYHTGDIGETVAERGVVFHGRARDTLRLRGFLVDPREIEQTILQHPSVDLAQVVGIDAPDVGQVAIAFARLVEDADPVTGEELQAFCRERIASYKTPSTVYFVERFPTVEGSNGVKIQKSRLREIALQRWTG